MVSVDIKPSAGLKRRLSSLKQGKTFFHALQFRYNQKAAFIFTHDASLGPVILHMIISVLCHSFALWKGEIPTGLEAKIWARDLGTDVNTLCKAINVQR